MAQKLPEEFKNFIDKLEYNTLVPVYQSAKNEEGETMAMVNLVAKLDGATFAKLPDSAFARTSSALYSCQKPRVCHLALVLSLREDDEIVLTTGFNLARETMARDYAVMRHQEKMRIVVGTDNDARIIHCNFKLEGIKLGELGKIVQSLGACDWQDEDHANLVRALNATYPTPKALLDAQRDSGPLVEVSLSETAV